MTEGSRVLIIHTGGTIGMARTPQGYAPQKGYIASAMAAIGELSSPGMPQYDLIEYEPLLDSSNISVAEWTKIARDIERHYDGYDGFVILHGTDTMAYTASSLAFMLEGLNKPVILTGSQIPLGEARSDARDNLVTSMLFAGNYDIPEVCLYFGGRLLRGCRSTKVSSDALQAFSSPNFPVLAEAGVDITVNRALLREPGGKLSLRLFEPSRIAVIKVFPGIQFDVFEGIMTDKLSGLVIEAFGTGNIPEDSAGLSHILSLARKNGTVIVVCTQCLRGYARIGMYQASRALAQAGAIGGGDMTVEAAVAKLYHLLSLDFGAEEIRRLMETNICGELTL